jgi:hypothetical protein
LRGLCAQHSIGIIDNLLISISLESFGMRRRSSSVVSQTLSVLGATISIFAILR